MVRKFKLILIQLIKLKLIIIIKQQLQFIKFKLIKQQQQLRIKGRPTSK